MKKIIFSLLALFFVCSCQRAAQEETKNGNFEVELLFEKDSCKVYRFYDGRYIYWANCAGKIQSDWTTSSGKSTQTHRSETIITSK